MTGLLHRSKSPLVNYFVSTYQECFGDRQPECLGGREIDGEIEFRRLLDRDIAGIRTVQDFVDMLSAASE